MFEHDDDDFIPDSSSSLFSIFNANTSSNEQTTLTYKAPKQPKPQNEHKFDDTIKPKTEKQSSVILAEVITLWKLEKGQNKLIGKHIVAIIGNSNQSIYELILYREKTNILIRQTLNQLLVLYKYPGNFIGFYDTQNQFWNLNFATINDHKRFLNEISKHNCVIVTKHSENNNDQVDNTVDIPENKIESGQTEVLTKPNAELQAKTEILSRITKMGQQILPRNPTKEKPNTEQSDSETESSYSDSKVVKPVTAPRKFKRNQNQSRTVSNSLYSENNTMLSPVLSNNSQFLANNNQLMLHPQNLMVSQPIPDYSVNNFIVAQNAELRANLTEINLKLNSVLNSQNKELHNCENNEEYKILKSKLKCFNLRIDNLTKDLESSRKDYEELRNNYESKCTELMELRQKNCNTDNLTMELNLMKNKVSDMELLDRQVELIQSELKEKDRIIEIQNLKLKDLEGYYQENENVKTDLSKEIANLNSKLEAANARLNETEKELRQKETQLSETSNITSPLNNSNYTRVIKECMNGSFKDIMENFDESISYSFNDIQEVMLKNLKKCTYTLINELNMV